MDSATAAAPSPLSGGNARQKRVLPSRTRRGGPGVGSCEIDLLILETQKRRMENEPLIPADTPFLLTTNASKYAEASGSINLGFNTLAHESYFDRPEVLKAYREQQVIETPEYINSADNPSVGGRFRPRGSEDILDTSDAAYERRHRKYETFEKRQRLREKEKLKHEQYKLRERIEQLRSMDGSAFLCLEPSDFPLRIHTTSSSDEEPPAATIAEGERRRKEMLDIALELEERYRVLLPPDRLKKYPGQPLAAATPSAASDVTMPVAPELQEVKADEGEEVEEEPETEAVTREVEKLTLRIRFTTSQQVNGSTRTPTREKSPTRKSKSVPRTTSPPRARRRKSKQPVVARSLGSEGPSPEEEPMQISAPAPTKATRTRKSAPKPAPPEEEEEESPMPDIQPENSAHSSPPSPSPSDGDPPPLPEAIFASVESPPPRPRKRMKAAAVVSPQPQLHHEHLRMPSVPPIESISAPPPRATSRHNSVHPPQRQLANSAVVGHHDSPPGFLLLTSIRNNKARPTIRHVTAFGVKVPLEISDLAEFELPYGIRPGEHDEGDSPPAEDLPVSRFTRAAALLESASTP
ncbi:hypothetical protein BDN72DRAFT_953848 [Pluteus cervinus]|uniref:Uncharacterized protein n=1 Tax=Pluteus cervinus TaxID=181527 RepID=A0ACD3BHA9_9AGAR|nr:hypothetical protein BDN72DRAFT_953848 [Pluteus cervinus]